MPPILDIVRAYIVAVPEFLVNPFFWVVIGLITLQYRRMAQMEKAFFGQVRRPVIVQVVVSLFFGLIGGLVGSLLLTGVGTTISPAWTGYVLILAIGLAFISPRLMCFAYAGGVLSLSRLVLGWPVALDVSSLLALIALLHAVESILMLISGHIGASPVCLRHHSGRLVGAYSVQKFWPVPLLALVFLPGFVGGGGGGGLAMPDWWPLIRPFGAEGAANLTLYMIPIVAGLGYGELAITMEPKQKVRRSALNLLLYSLVLLLMAWLSTSREVFLWIGAVFAPLGHEVLVYIGNLREREGQPLFVNDGPGLMVMDVMPGSVAHQAGLRQRDVILTVNGQQVDSISGLRMAWRVSFGQIQLWVKRNGRGLILNMKASPEENLGLIMVPDEGTTMYLENRFSSPLEWFHRRFFSR